MTTDSVFRWTWEPKPEWREALAEFSPRSAHRSWLEWKWVAGHPTDPMQRWVAFECIPEPHVPDFLLAQLYFNDPRRQALHSWAHQFYKTNAALPVPFWVCQGWGGHKFRYTNEDRELALWQGIEEGSAPAIGDLPYAEPSRLTLELMRLASYMDARHGTLDAARAARIDELKRRCRQLTIDAVYDWGIPDDIKQASRYINDGALTNRMVYKGDPGAHGDLSAMTAKYVETGVIDSTI